MHTTISTLRRRRRDERGASVLEWAMIAAVMVLAASLIGAVIFGVVRDKGDELENCANQPTGQNSC